MAQPPLGIISDKFIRFRYILVFYAPIQARIFFEAFFVIEDVASSPRSCAKKFRHLGWAPLFYNNPVSQVGTHSRSAGQLLLVLLQAYHTPLSVRQQRSNCYHTLLFTPPNTPCGCSDVLSHPLAITPPHLSHRQTHLVGIRTSCHTP